MSYVGVFRKKEMDGKLSLLYTLTPTDNPISSNEELTMDSGGDPLQPSFFCPRARVRFQMFRLVKDDDDDDDKDNITFNKYDYCLNVDHDIKNECIPFNSSPHFSTTRGCESLLDCDDRFFCKLPVDPLFWCNNKEPNPNLFNCKVCLLAVFSVSYYACFRCESMFHKECVESPLEIKHPSHPFHSLQLRTPIHFSDSKRLCNSCGIEVEGMSYECTTCDLSMHPVCAMKPVPFVIEHPKSHPHPLTLFPTQDSLVCHTCSLIQKLDPTYICVQCVFVTHIGCIDFPHVIRISRHFHRISFTYFLPSGKISCGVCREQVDNKYGAYSCNKCDAYFVHSKCALHPKVWDGKDLEGVPEEDDEIDDGEPFVRISDGIILHPFHSHHMQLEIFKAYDENKYCRGCILPIYEGQFYSCMECDFILHESCANAPRMKRHPLHPHPLTLNAANEGPGDEIGKFVCTSCERVSTGFYYEHHIEDPISGRTTMFFLDLRCATIIEPVNYQGHKHPLFLPWELHQEKWCQMCKEKSDASILNCTECDYIICFHCATIPYKVRYKHDNHFLKICDGKEASDQASYWCEICEGEIKEGKLATYNCNDCCTTLHVECLLGLNIYMKPIKTATQLSVNSSYTGLRIERLIVCILLNSSLSRQVCSRCRRRCPYPTFFIGLNGLFYCCLFCI